MRYTGGSGEFDRVEDLIQFPKFPPEPAGTDGVPHGDDVDTFFGQPLIISGQRCHGLPEVVQAFIEDDGVELLNRLVGFGIGLEETGAVVLPGIGLLDSGFGEVDAEVMGVAGGAQVFLEEACTATNIQDGAAGGIVSGEAGDHAVVGELISVPEIVPFSPDILSFPSERVGLIVGKRLELQQVVEQPGCEWWSMCHNTKLCCMWL